MLKVAITNGVKNVDGTFNAPSDLTKYAFIATDEQPQTAHIGGLEPGDEVALGEFYAGEFNTEANKFVGSLIPVSAFTVGGDPTPKHITVTTDSDGADVTVDSASDSATAASNNSSASSASN